MAERDELTPLASRLVDRAYDRLDRDSRGRGEIPQFMWTDVQHAVAAVLRELVACDVYRGEANFEYVADELDGETVPDYHLAGERKRWLPKEET